MGKPTGPAVSKWILGEELSAARTAAMMTQGEAAAILDCSIPKIQRIEYGTSTVDKSEMEALLNAYGVTDHSPYEKLRKAGKGRGWWVKYGKVPKRFADFLGAEMAASQIRAFAPIIVTGLLQTEAYARAIAEVSDGPIPPAEVERQVKLRLERQHRVFDEDPPKIWMILDESVLHRCVGSPQIMADQLEHLLYRTDNGDLTIQVMPFSKGAHISMRGALMILEFPENIHSPIGYVESNAGSLYLEDEDDQERCSLQWQHLSADAASRQESLGMIERAVSRFRAASQE